MKKSPPPNKHKIHHLDIYSMKIHFWHCPFDRLAKYGELAGMPEEWISNPGVGRAIMHNFEGHVWINPLCKINTAASAAIIAHECFHMAELIMMTIHQSHQEGRCNEPLAYLLDHLVYEFLKKMQ